MALSIKTLNIMKRTTTTHSIIILRIITPSTRTFTIEPQSRTYFTKCRYDEYRLLNAMAPTR